MDSNGGRDSDTGSNLGGIAKVYQDIQGLRIALGNKTWAAENTNGRAMPAIFNDMITQLKGMEASLMKEAGQQLKYHPAWPWLKQVKGLGPTLACQLIGYINDISMFDTVSKLWKYCGLAVVNGKADGRRKGEKVSYSPRMKALMYNIGCSFLKSKSPYRKLYDDTKARYQHTKQDMLISVALGCDISEVQLTRQTTKDATWKKYLDTAVKAAKEKELPEPWNDGRIHLTALRKMEKVFLAHLWEKWREAEGLPLRREYVFEVLGHTTRYTPEDFVS